MEYCHVPLPLADDVIAMPCSDPESGSVTDAPMNDATVWPALAVWSSVIVFNDGAIGVSTGASLMDVTVMVALSVAVLKAVVPPLLEASTLLPTVPLVWSQAR